MQKTTFPVFFDNFRCHDVASPYVPSPNVFWGLYILEQCILLGRCVPLTMPPLNDALPGRCVPYQCVPTMGHIQVVDNHNSNSSFAHANGTHRHSPDLTFPMHYNVSNPSKFVACFYFYVYSISVPSSCYPVRKAGSPIPLFLPVTQLRFGQKITILRKEYE
jgi:hypothetical protein